MLNKGLYKIKTLIGEHKFLSFFHFLIQEKEGNG